VKSQHIGKVTTMKQTASNGTKAQLLGRVVSLMIEQQQPDRAPGFVAYDFSKLKPWTVTKRLKS
jgi:hypothetical protein